MTKINYEIVFFYGVILLYSNCVGALRQVFIVSLSGIRSQSWLWVAWPHDHEVRIMFGSSYGLFSLGFLDQFWVDLI